MEAETSAGRQPVEVLASRDFATHLKLATEDTENTEEYNVREKDQF